MRLIKAEQATKHTTIPAQRPFLSVVKANANGRKKLPRDQAVAEAVKRTG